MKKILFQDMDGHEIQVSVSGSGDYRIYYNVDKDDSPCLLLNKYQVYVLINSLFDLMQD